MAKPIPFLSDAWFEAVKSIVSLQEAEAGGGAHSNLTMNLVITDTPFGERQMHMGQKDGKAQWGQGHTEGADVTMTTDYATAKDVFISGNPQAGMQAFMQGKIKVQGDMAKLMAGGGGTGGNSALLSQIQEITE